MHIWDAVNLQAWQFDWYGWVILPLIIFAARVADVTLGTIRIIFVSRGKRNLAPLLGFCEVLIWIIAISQIVQNIHSVPTYFGYAAGFAAGNYVGMLLEDRLALGTVIIRVIIQNGGVELGQALHDHGYGFTAVDGSGSSGPVKLVYSVIPRKDLRKVVDIIHQINPRAFYSVEDIRSSESGVFPSRSQTSVGSVLGRKAK